MLHLWAAEMTEHRLYWSRVDKTLWSLWFCSNKEYKICFIMFNSIFDTVFITVQALRYNTHRLKSYFSIERLNIFTAVIIYYVISLSINESIFMLACFSCKLNSSLPADVSLYKPSREDTWLLILDVFVCFIISRIKVKRQSPALFVFHILLR